MIKDMYERHRKSFVFAASNYQNVNDDHKVISYIGIESDREVAGEEYARVGGSRQYIHIPVLKCGCTGNTTAAPCSLII